MELMSLGLAPAGFLSVTSFVASSHPADSCGLNGLPLTPNSVKILGNGQILKSIDHPHLAKVVDIIRGKRQRIAIVSECWKENLRQQIEDDLSSDELLSMSAQILSGLTYLNSMNIVNLNLTPENILFNAEKKVKLFGYGYGRLTDYGKLVAFPIGSPRYTAPDVLLRGMQTSLDMSVDLTTLVDGSTTIPEQVNPPDSPQADIWSLGMILARQIFGIQEFWPSAKVGQVLRKIISLGNCSTGAAVLDKLAREHNCINKLNDVDQRLLNVIHACLTPDANERPSPEMLLKMIVEKENFENNFILEYSPPAFPVMRLRCKDLNLKNLKRPKSCLEFLSLEEIYYLWQLAGGDIMTELCKHGLMVTTPPVISSPTLVTGEGQEFGVPRQRGALLDSTIIPLPLDQLITCLTNVPTHHLIPSMKDISNREINTLPLVIKEKDVRFQCRRVVAYRKLLQGYPHRRNGILDECSHDIVPFYRPQLWAALLQIDFDTQYKYQQIDKETPNPVDRQIEVDIPRCHQYNELLASPQGHRKLKRVLKAWVMSNPNLVYWQGLDSLCAPFLLLNFNNESLAWACLSKFIPKYLYNMFQKDNASVIQEYLAKFSHLQAFYDPVLFNHMDEIGFIPDLYAIPWVLTMFSHVFPLHKIFHLWDTLLLGNSSYPLCVGLAILLQLRSQLLESQFNECILLFSEMPSVDIDQVVSQSKLISEAVPPSLLFRANDQPDNFVKCQVNINSSAGYTDLDLPHLPVSLLKSEKVGRMSGRDCIAMLDTRQEGYSPAKLQFLELSLVPANAGLELAKSRGSIVAVLGRECAGETLQVADVLLAHQFPRVVTIHGGIEVFKRTNFIIVPSLSSPS